MFICILLFGTATSGNAAESFHQNINQNQTLPNYFIENPTSFPNSPESLKLESSNDSSEFYELPAEQKESIFSVRTNRSAGAVGVMRIYSTGSSGSSSFSDLGHSWISITNFNGNNLNIGGVSVADGKSITLGTWGNLQHKGLWYNTEGYVQSK